MTPTFNDIRKQVERRYRRQVIFGLHLTLFIAVCAYLGCWLLTHELYFRDAQHLWIMAMWFVFLAAHWFVMRLGNTRDREIQQAWERYGFNYKPEFETYPAYLSGDDEVVEWQPEDSMFEKAKRHS